MFAADCQASRGKLSSPSTDERGDVVHATRPNPAIASAAIEILGMGTLVRTCPPDGPDSSVTLPCFSSQNAFDEFRLAEDVRFPILRIPDGEILLQSRIGVANNWVLAKGIPES